MYEIERFTITEMLEKASVQYAERPALAMLGAPAVSYAELEPKTRRVASLLGLLGCAKGDRAALISENRPEWGISYLGISRAGCVAVPILTDFTTEQMGNIIAHSESRFVFASKRFAPKLAPVIGDRTLIAVEDLAILASPRTDGPALPQGRDLAAAWDAAAAAFVSPDIRADDLAAIIYTSGTTGQSKGVMLTNRNIIYNAWSARRFIVLRRTDRLLSILPLAHAYEFTVGFIIPLMHGSCVSYLDKPPSASVLLPALAKLRPTIMLSVPLVIEKIYHSNIKPKLEKIALYKYPGFKLIFERIAGAKLMKTFGGKVRFFGIGGAPLAADVETFLNRAGFPYSIGYGLTETAPLLTGNKPGRVKLHTTGLPATGVELRIADPRPDTGEGEIQARGPNVSPGYYKDPAKTAEAFTSDGWFRTGDLGTMTADGRITVRGRIKTLILGAAGENIYPEEIEALINGSPYVQESLVYGAASGLTALIQLKPEALEIFEAELRARVMDTIDDAKEAAARVKDRLGQAEDEIAVILENIRKQTNMRLAAFSRLSAVKIQNEPFEKTPTQKIKRFLYPKKF